MKCCRWRECPQQTWSCFIKAAQSYRGAKIAFSFFLSRYSRVLSAGFLGRNTYKRRDIEFFKNRQNSNFSLTVSLTTVINLKAKRSSAQPPFYVITNSPVGCVFWDSDECRSSTPCLFFYLLLVSSSSKTYQDINSLPTLSFSNI